MAKNRRIPDSKLSVEEQLNLELRSLQGKVRRGYELGNVCWLPGKQIRNPEGKLLDGEVKPPIVYIYTEKEPVFTLKHEFACYLLNRDKAPLIDLVSKLLAHIMYSHYKNSEELADTLAKLL